MTCPPLHNHLFLDGQLDNYQRQSSSSSTMATVTRQPFAPLNEARLQNLTSLKNRQNCMCPMYAHGSIGAQ